MIHRLCLLETIKKISILFLIGELPWNMFDFATDQTTIRIGGLNRKGLFTRQRQPKAAAFAIKNRYEQLEFISTA